MPKGVRPSTAWKKGQSGNPKGSKPEKLMRDALLIALNREAEKGSKTKRWQSGAEAIVAKAIEGDVAACREIFDRVDGKVPQAHDIKSEHTVTYESESLSRFAGWLTEASAKAANGHDEDVGAE